jgi:hypothetical protein
VKLTKELFEESLDCTPDLKDLEILFKAADGKVLAQALHYATAMIGSSPNPMEMLAKTVLAFSLCGHVRPAQTVRSQPIGSSAQIGGCG